MKEENAIIQEAMGLWKTCLLNHPTLIDKFYVWKRRSEDCDKTDLPVDTAQAFHNITTADQMLLRGLVLTYKENRECFQLTCQDIVTNIQA